MQRARKVARRDVYDPASTAEHVATCDTRRELHNLPDAVLILMMEFFVGIETLLRCESVCKRWQYLGTQVPG